MSVTHFFLFDCIILNQCMNKFLKMFAYPSLLIKNGISLVQGKFALLSKQFCERGLFHYFTDLIMKQQLFDV